MKKILRNRDIFLLGLSNVLDILEEIKDPLGIIGKGYEQMYGFVPTRYKKHDFNNLVWRNLKTGYIERVIKNGKPYLRLSSCGKKKIERDYPLIKLQNTKWDKKWRIVAFDIEEKSKKLRERFRSKLKELGFGMLQKSVFITPNDIVKDFAEFIESQEMEDSVYIMEVSQIVGNIRDLVDKIWNTEKLNEEYREILDELENSNLVLLSDRLMKLDSKEREKLLNATRKIRKKYFEIILKDPFLPKELLPDYWLGKKVGCLVKNLEKINLHEEKF